jgi:endonuclease G, mitochondrial
MTARSTDGVEAEVGRALATLEASAERVYYDPDPDASVRTAYYAAIDDTASPTDLFGALGALLEHTHAPRVAYKPAERVYPWVDLHPDLKLRSVYSRKAFDAEEFIRADAEIARRRSAELQELARRESTLGPREFEAAFDALEAQLPFNCEHVVPQSWFAKHEPMRGDLHHLFACESGCNSFRGNTPSTFPTSRRCCGTPAGAASKAASSPLRAKVRSGERRCTS